MTRNIFRLVFLPFALAMVESGCGGGGIPSRGPTFAIASSTTTVPVGAARSASVIAGPTIATVAMPAATAGSGSLTIAGSASAPASSSASGYVDPIVSPPGTEIAYVSFTASASATYAAFPTFAFTLPAGTSTANESFALVLYDSNDDISLETIAMPGTVGAPATSGGGPTISFPAQSFSIAVPVIVGAPPILPVTLRSGTTYGFGLLESTITPSPSPT